MNAQNNLVKTNRAVELVQSGDLISARDAIDAALASPEEGTHPYTWFVKGYVHKEIYKKIEKSSIYSENREEAITAIKKSLELDQGGKYKENNIKALTFLSKSYYNDAVVLTRSLTAQNLTEPEVFYSKYKELWLFIEPATSFSEKDIEFYKNLARGCRLIYEQDKVNNLSYFDQMVDYYNKAIALNPNDYGSNYNLAVNFYNRGVHEIRKIDHNTEIFELIMIQDACIELFKQSLPYMNKAHELRPKRKETLQGLRAIYRSLSDQDKSDHFEAEMTRLIKSGEIQE